MALTRDFRETVRADAARDPKFRAALLTEALDAYLAGDVAAGKAVLRDLVNATIGFERLAAEVKKPSKSLHRMLAPRGNPSSQNLFEIVSALQRETRVKLRISATILAGTSPGAKRFIGSDRSAGDVARHTKRLLRERIRSK